MPYPTGNHCGLPWEWGRALTYSVCIVMLHQHNLCRACPLCWATDLYKCTVMATAWQAWKEGRQWTRRRHEQGEKNALIQGIYWSGLSCLRSNSRMHAVVFKPWVFNWINVRDGYYQLGAVNRSLRINGCWVAEPNSVQKVVLCYKVSNQFLRALDH